MCFENSMGKDDYCFVGEFIIEVDEICVFVNVRDEEVVGDECWDGLVFGGGDVDF